MFKEQINKAIQHLKTNEQDRKAAIAIYVGFMLVMLMWLSLEIYNGYNAGWELLPSVS